jgi:PAS domain S-box-containing protein
MASRPTDHDHARAWRDSEYVSTPLELEETTDTLFRAVAAVADALYVVDSGGRIAFLNPAALKILGYTDEDELLGKPSHATIHFLRPDGSPFPEEECPLLRPLLSGATVRIERDWFVRKDGSSVPVAYSSAPVDLDRGRGAVVAFRDLSERLRLGEVEASRARIARAAYAARRTIQRDLHDGAQQQFVSVALQLENAQALVVDQPAEAGHLLAAAQANLAAAIEELRRLAHGIHPAELSERGLEAALRSLAQRTALPVELTVEKLGRPAPETESAAYFIAAEATANVVKHATAAQIEIEVTSTRDELRITVTDDGAGGASFGDGAGLQGLRDRAEAIGGHLTVDSPVGGPTVLTAELPLFRSRRSLGPDAERLRVIVADDAAVIRQALAELLERSGVEVLSQVGDATALLEEVERLSPDVAITDIHMPPTQTREGARAAIEIRRRFPGVGLLLLSSYVEVNEVIGLFAEAASGVGYLLKDSVANVDQLLDALERISDGEIVLDPRLVVDLLGRPERPDPLAALTAREREVVELMAQGRSNAAIATTLWITEGAVEKHIKHVFNKLRIPVAPETHRRVLAVLTFLDAPEIRSSQIG